MKGSARNAIRVPFTFRLQQFLFTTDPQLFSFRHPGIKESRGMSGAIYGPDVPFAGEIWHQTSGGYLQIRHPMLLAPDAPVGDVPQLEQLPLTLRSHLPRDFGIALLCQISLVEGAGAAYALAMESPVFMPELARLRVLFVSHYQDMNNGLVYDRRIWPEPAVVTYGALKLKAPRVGPEKIRAHVDARGIVVADIAQTTFLAARPEGRGEVLYKIFRDEYNRDRVYSTSSFGGVVHPPREIDVAGEFSVYDVVFLMIERRLGDVLVMRGDEVEGFWPLAAKPEQTNEIVRQGDFLFHPQHGVIKMRPGDGFYAVDYARP